MMNQVTPYLGALPSLINSESINHHRQPKIGNAVTVEWKANTEKS
jgi:hypothetical protein